MTLKQGSECIVLFVGYCIKCSRHDHAFVCVFVLCDLLKILLYYSLHRATSDVSMYQQSLNRVKVRGVCVIVILINGNYVQPSIQPHV